MLNVPPAVRIFLCLEPADFRKQFDGLAALVTQVLGEDCFSGNLFVFRNRRGDRVKILYWDRDGYALWYKRLEKGVFRFQVRGYGHSRYAEVDWAELAMLLEGIDVASVKRSPRYRRPAKRPA
jgi:transposase